MRTAARLAVVLGLAVAASGARGAVSWDEHETVDGMRWTARATQGRMFELGSDREGRGAVDDEIEGVLVLPGEFKGGWVTAIGAHAFTGMEGITEVRFPDGLRSIGAEAFAGCTGLTRVVLPDGVYEVGEGAFAGCTALNEVVLGVHCLQVHSRAFEGCSALERIEIRGETGRLSIGDRAFAGCSGLARLDIAGRLLTMGDKAFSGCKGLKEIIVRKSGYFMMGRRVFAGCDALERVAWEREVYFSVAMSPDAQGKWSIEQVRRQGIDAFEGCTGIREVVINAMWPGQFGLAAIFPDAFAKIRKVTILEGSRQLPEGLFRGCAELEEVVLPESVTAMGAGVFEGCGKLKAVRWPTGLREVDPEALRGSCIEEGPVVAGNQDGETAE